MATTIQTRTGAMWHTNAPVEDVRNAIMSGDLIDIWWFSSWGQRYKERVWIPEDEVAFIRTESDDG